MEYKSQAGQSNATTFYDQMRYYPAPSIVGSSRDDDTRQFTTQKPSILPDDTSQTTNSPDTSDKSIITATLDHNTIIFPVPDRRPFGPKRKKWDQLDCVTLHSAITALKPPTRDAKVTTYPNVDVEQIYHCDPYDVPGGGSATHYSQITTGVKVTVRMEDDGRMSLRMGSAEPPSKRYNTMNNVACTEVALHEPSVATYVGREVFTAGGSQIYQTPHLDWKGFKPVSTELNRRDESRWGQDTETASEHGRGHVAYPGEGDRLLSSARGEDEDEDEDENEGQVDGTPCSFGGFSAWGACFGSR